MKEKTKELESINSLEDLIQGTLRTLEGVMNGTIDNRRASKIFAESRKATGALKRDLEAMRLGLNNVGRVEIGKLENLKKIAQS